MGVATFGFLNLRIVRYGPVAVVASRRRAVAAFRHESSDCAR
jgi:hypothetical protein